MNGSGSGLRQSNLGIGNDPKEQVSARRKAVDVENFFRAGICDLGIAWLVLFGGGGIEKIVGGKEKKPGKVCGIERGFKPCHSGTGGA
jgi:hypothetical protein